jgi:hypothetical protein
MLITGQFTQYFAFCAVVVLYVYTIQQAHAHDNTYRRHFDAAERCQGQIAAISEGGSLAQRYTVVLEELRLEAVKQTQLQHELHNRNRMNMSSILQPTIPDSQLDSRDVALNNGTNGNDQDGTQASVDMFSVADSEAFNIGPNSTTPSSLIAELTSWGEFDSLVSWSFPYPPVFRN